MSDSAAVHEEKYRLAKASGSPGWGGAERIANLPSVLRERFLSYEKVPSTGKLLELGCGAANVSIELATYGFDIYGVDFSETAVAWAKENALSKNIEAEFTVTNATDLSAFKTQFFDIVYDGNCLHCIIGNDRAKVLRECYRVLKNNGILFVSSLCTQKSDFSFPAEFDAKSRILYESDAPYRYITTPDSICEELSTNGFRILKSVVRVESPFGHINIHAQKI